MIGLSIEVVSPEIMADWLARGWMPNLATLRRRGAWSRLSSVAELSSGSIWPSFVTGLGPGRHGQFFTHMQLATGTYRIVKKYADDLPAPPFWRTLGDAGRPVALVDLPQTRPEPGFPGVHVVGWGGEYPAWPRSSEPPGLMRKILRRFGSHPLAEQLRLASRPEGTAACERLVADLLAGAKKKAALLDWIDDHGPFDLFLGVFAETHWAMHLLWHTLDTAHPEHDPALAPRCGPVFERICRIIDGAIGRFLERHREARFVVFSLSGMGPNYSGWHLLPELLRRMELAAPGAEAGPARQRFGPGVLGRVERLTDLALVDHIKAMLPAQLWDTWSRRLLFARIGWRESRAFCLPNDQSGAIRINLEGREPNGLVAPGTEHHSLCREIEETLRGLVHPLTGRRIVADVIRCSDVFPGEHVDDLPDLVVVWNTEAPIDGASSERCGAWHAPSPERRTGGHRNEGFVLAAGPGIVPGSAPEVIDLVDLPASILALCGADVPADLDGKVIPWTGQPK